MNMNMYVVLFNEAHCQSDVFCGIFDDRNDAISLRDELQKKLGGSEDFYEVYEVVPNVYFNGSIMTDNLAIVK